MRAPRLLTVWLLLGVCCGRPPTETTQNIVAGQPLQIAPPNSGANTAAEASAARVDLDPLPGFIAALPVRQVNLQDPVYGRAKTYEGYVLEDVVRAAFKTSVADDAELVFVSSDGYRAFLPWKNLRDGGVLARRDVSMPAGILWEPVRQGRQMVLPAPFYLVWPSEPDSGVEYPWPYQVIALEVRSKQIPMAAAAREDPVVARGDALFRQGCSPCHAVNLVGGTLGPELNIPANVTEYWHPDALRLFIADPSRIRIGSKMPKSPYLTSDDVRALVAYLVFMKDHKIAVP